MSLTATQVVSEFGAYYLGNENNQNASRILQLPLQKSETADLFPLQITEAQGLERRAQVGIDRILQPFQKAFTPISTTTFTPRSIAMFRLKIDLQENPDDLVSSWLGFLTSNNLDRTTWPFVRWWIEEVLMKGHQRDLEMNEIFGGAYAAPTPGTAGSSGTAMDGIKTLINDAYAAGDLDGMVTLGAVPSDAKEFCTYVEDFCKGIPELYWGEKMEIAMSKVLQVRYREGRALKYNMNYAQETNLDQVKNYENFSVKGLSSHYGSTKIWTTPSYNKARLVNGIGNIEKFEVEKVDRKVKLYTDYFLGIGFWIPEIIFTNDVELT